MNVIRHRLRQIVCKNVIHLVAFSDGPKSALYGYSRVTEAEKVEKVHITFSNVATNYDLMNDIMSCGIHRLWKDYFVRTIDPVSGGICTSALPSSDKVKILDVAGGTGDMAVRVINYMNRSTTQPHLSQSNGYKVTIVDINNNMLKEGRQKLKESDISWVRGDALQLPFPDNSFHIYMVAFGVRNMANYQKAITEACRVIVPGGMFMCMEFSKPSNPWISRFYDIYSFNVIPILGELIAKDRNAYQYLVESIRTFPDKEEFTSIMMNSGLCGVVVETFTGGTVTIYKGFKPVTQ